MRLGTALVVACLLFGCGGGCSRAGSGNGVVQPGSSALAPASPVTSAPSPPPPIAEASYGDAFPRLDRVPEALGGAPFGPRELRLIVQPLGNAAPLPWAKRLVELRPGLRVVVIDHTEDERTIAWLGRSGLLHLRDDPSDLRHDLDVLTRDPKLGNYLALVTSPWPSMAASDGVAREYHEACLFHGPWLVWAGAVADARYPIETAARGAWSRPALDAFESIRKEQDSIVSKLKKGGEAVKELVTTLLARPDVRPARLMDVSQAMLFSLQAPKDAELARALSDRAVEALERLDFAIAKDAGLVHYMTGDSEGALRYGKLSTERCEEVQTDCKGDRALFEDWQRCPFELVEVPAAVRSVLPAKFLPQPRAGSPKECKKY